MAGEGLLAPLVDHARFLLDVLRGGLRDVKLRDGLGNLAALLEELDDVRALRVVEVHAGLALGGTGGGLATLALGLDAVRLVEGDDEFVGGRETDFGGEGLEERRALLRHLLGEFGDAGIGLIEFGNGNADDGGSGGENGSVHIRIALTLF